MNELLFVDDDASTVRALGQVVRRNRDRWNVRFAIGAAEALEAMQWRAADVIVTDMQMPLVSGEELLKQVKRKWPATVRVLLSGDYDDEIGRRLVDLVHVSLAKPIEAAFLLLTLDRICKVLDQLDSPELRQFVGTLGKLPVVSRVAMEFRQLLATKEPTAREAAAVIEQSPSLTARILHLGNSAFSIGSRRISSVERAVMVIGFDTLLALVVAGDLFVDGHPGDKHRDTLERLQARGLFAARLARAMTPTGVSRAGAWTAALLHDIGLYALIAGKRSLLDDVHARMRETGAGLAEAERALWGTTHATLGAYLLGVWGFEWDVLHAVASCEVQTGGAVDDDCSIACVAATLADEFYPVFADAPDLRMRYNPHPELDQAEHRHAAWRELALVHHLEFQELHNAPATR